MSRKTSEESTHSTFLKLDAETEHGFDSPSDGSVPSSGSAPASPDPISKSVYKHAEAEALPSYIIRDLVLLAFLGVGTGFAFGLPLPSMQSFVEDAKSNGGMQDTSTMYSIIVAAFNAGEFVGALAAGPLESYLSSRMAPLSAPLLSNPYTSYANSVRALRLCLLCSAVFGVAGGFLYATAAIGSVAAIGRFVTGLWSGAVNVLMRVYWSRVVPKQKLKKIMTVSAFFVVMAMALSPGVGALTAETAQPVAIYSSITTLNIHTLRSPGWIIVMFCAVSLVCSFFLAKPQAPSTDSDEFLLSSVDSIPSAAPLLGSSELPPKSVASIVLWNTNGLPNSIILNLIYAFFVFSWGFTVVESVATPLQSDQLGIDVSGSSVLYVVGGVSGAVAFIFVYFISEKKLLDNHKQCLIVTTIAALGAFLMIDFQAIPSVANDECRAFSCSFNPSETCNLNTTVLACRSASQSLGCVWNQDVHHCTTCAPVCHNPSHILSAGQLYSGFTLVNVGFLIGRVCTAVMYSNLLQDKRDGFMQGLLVGSGSLARIIGPLIAIALYDFVDNRTYAVMGLLFGLFASSVVTSLILYRKTHTAFEEKMGLVAPK